MFKTSLFGKSMFIVIGIVLIYSFIIISFIIPKVNNNIENLQETNAKEVLNKIALITKNVHYDLELYKKEIINTHKKRLVNVMDTLYSSLEPLSSNKQYNQKQLQSKIVQTVQNTRYGKNGYFWINDFEPKMIMHPFTPNLNGKSLKELQDPNGIYLFNEMVSTIKKQSKGFVSYSWPKPGEEQAQPKISHVRLFEKFNWIIGTGVYIENIQKEISHRKEKLKKQLNDIIATTKIGQSGYFVIFNKEGKILAHPIASMKGKNIKKLKVPGTQNTVFQTFTEASKNKDKSIHYLWDRPDDKGNYTYEKLAWVEFIPELGWYICATIYLDDFKNISHETIVFIATISFITLLLSLLVGFTFLKYILKPIKELSKFSSQVTQGNYTIRSNIQRDDEIGELSDDFNTMVNTIEHQINNLEKNVQKEIENNRRNELQLLEQSKMASMGDMIGNIAHQWRQPLSVISTASTGILLKKQIDQLSDEELEKLCTHINDNAQYLSKTIDTFRDFLKEKKELKEVILQESIQDALNIVQTALNNHHIQLINMIDNEKPLKIKLIAGELAEVIINIINNAKDALNEKNIENKWVKVELKKANRFVQIIIEDNGDGIADDIMPRIFEPYFTTKHGSQGTGLGLHMSYKIVTESFQGKLMVINSKNGAKFIIQIPLQ